MNDVFKAIADTTRREILLMLTKSPESINTISEKFNMSRPAISKHIQILKNSDLVKIEADKTDGRQRNCYAQLEALQEVDAFMKQLSSFWENNLEGLGNYLNQQTKGK